MKNKIKKLTWNKSINGIYETDRIFYDTPICVLLWEVDKMSVTTWPCFSLLMCVVDVQTAGADELVSWLFSFSNRWSKLMLLSVKLCEMPRITAQIYGYVVAMLIGCLLEFVSKTASSMSLGKEKERLFSLFHRLVENRAKDSILTQYTWFPPLCIMQQ